MTPFIVMYKLVLALLEVCCEYQVKVCSAMLVCQR